MYLELVHFRRNIIGFTNNDELKRCRFTQTDSKNRFCPIFVLGDIAGFAGIDNFEDIAIKVNADLRYPSLEMHLLVNVVETYQHVKQGSLG